MNRAWLTFLLLLSAFAAHDTVRAQHALSAVEPDLDRPVAQAGRPARYDSLMLRDNFLRVQKIVNGQKSYHDSTATTVLDRNNWQNACIVTDWTASMLAHDALLMRWHFQHLQSGTVSHFVFFNDGDGKYDDEKQTGLTGGVYHCPGGDSMALWQSMERCVMGGNGGDHRENVLEALMEAFMACPGCNEFVLVADNNAPIRDFSLIDNIDRPVRVVLVGVYKDGIHPDYLNLAYISGGSLHTRDADYFLLKPDERSGYLQLGTHTYDFRRGRYLKANE